MLDLLPARHQPDTSPDNPRSWFELSPPYSVGDSQSTKPTPFRELKQFQSIPAQPSPIAQPQEGLSSPSWTCRACQRRKLACSSHSGLQHTEGTESGFMAPRGHITARSCGTTVSVMSPPPYKALFRDSVSAPMPHWESPQTKGSRNCCHTTLAGTAKGAACSAGSPAEGALTDGHEGVPDIS